MENKGISRIDVNKVVDNIDKLWILWRVQSLLLLSAASTELSRMQARKEV